MSPIVQQASKQASSWSGTKKDEGLHGCWKGNGVSDYVDLAETIIRIFFYFTLVRWGARESFEQKIDI